MGVTKGAAMSTSLLSDRSTGFDLLAPIERLIAALAAHRAGKVREAEQGYRSVLAEEAENPSALRLLGLLLLGSGRAEEAVGVLKRAAALQSDDVDTHTALADGLVATGERDQAIRMYRAILATWPGHHAARINLANALRDSGDAAGAIAECRLTLAIAPRLVAAHITLGSALLAYGRVVEAIGAYRTAVTLDGSSPVALTGFAMALMRDRRAVDALAAAMKATELAPGFAEGWFVRGVAEHALMRHGEARVSLERAVGIQAGHARAQLALGNVLADLDDLAGAEACIRTAIAGEPGLAEAHASLGFVLSAMGRLDAAVAACDVALERAPEFARAHWNRGIAHLLAGNYLAGWQDYEWRRRDERFAADFPELAGAQWQGGSLAGKTILVWAEQGLGDCIQFARYLPLLAARGGRVVVACAGPLVKVLGGIEGVADVVPLDGALPHYDCWVFQMSLPLLFGTTLETIPAPGGYIAAPVAVPGARRRVGLVWAGNPGHSNDGRRSLPTAALAPLAKVADIEWVNLQLGGKGAELAIMHRMAAPAGGLADLAATAERIAGLDLVISADTAVAHLAGAMGKPVWVLLAHAPDWRWLRERADSPWYDSARLFRQKRAGDWDGVIADVVEALAG